MLLIVSIFNFFKSKTLNLNNWIVIFIFSCILIQLIINGSTFGVSTFILVLFCFLVLKDEIDEEKLFKWFKIFGTFSMLGIAYHSLQLYVLGTAMSSLNIFPLTNDVSLNWTSEMRPHSFFPEPQAFASYMMPFLYLSLKRRKFIWALVITVSVLLSTSSQGIVMMMILWIGFVFFELKSKNYKIFVAAIILFFLLVFSFAPVFEFSRNKIIETEISGNPRLARGFDVFNKMEWHDKVFGIGYGNVGEYVYERNNQFDWSIGNESVRLLNYTSGFSGLLVQFGLIGIAIFLIMIYHLWRKGKPFHRVMLFMIFSSFFFQNIVLNSWFVFFFMFYSFICTSDPKITRIVLKNNKVI